jgi:hypothetical protein
VGARDGDDPNPGRTRTRLGPALMERSLSRSFYGPKLGGSLIRGIQSAGGLVTRDQQLLIDVVAP